ncbi:MAG: carboxyl-terminal protease [Acidobacteria bacterium]|nr:carboxyl-terminal protease [Acidobacteriota bacterium]
MKHRFAVLLALVVLLSSLVGGLLGGNAAAKSGSSSQASANDFLTDFTEALDIVQRTYVEKVGPDKLVYSAIKGMLRVLDPHSSFFDPKDFARLREEQHSKYYGLGIRVRPLGRDRGRVTIVEPPQIGSPAEKVGLRAGDVISKIEGEPIDDWTSDEVVSHLRGPRGTTVNITVERPGLRDPLELAVVRDEIPLITVPYAFEVKPGIGYVKIDRFSESTSEELHTRLKEVDAANLSGLILDLRDNPGGLLNQAIDVSDFFLPRNELIVSTKGRAKDSARSYRAPGLEKITVPLVVLINRHSASASEIVAGALQDHDRALIVGETSFGKGLVQSVYTLENDTGMALTTAKYYTPSGRLIQRDYSGSTFEYFFLNGLEASVPENTGNKEREIRYTDNKRKVYGGGGITPDAVVPTRELNRFEGRLAAKDIYFQYARRLTSGQVPSASHFQLEEKAKSLKSIPSLDITDAIMLDFKNFLRNRNIEFTDEDIQSNADFIKRRIRREVFNSLFGLQEGVRIDIQGDNQVQKALEMMPEAKLLMSSGRATPAAQNSIR